MPVVSEYVDNPRSPRHPPFHICECRRGDVRAVFVSLIVAALLTAGALVRGHGSAMGDAVLQPFLRPYPAVV